MTENPLESGSVALVGHTGFVGNSLKRQYKYFRGAYNSENISDISGKAYDALICAAAPATMWLANNDPEKDRQNLLDLTAWLEKANCKRVVLISTIAVLDDFAGRYSEENASFESAKAYGKNRRELEERIQSAFPSVHIMRLPALFGPGLKKNYIFDVLNPAPAFLKRGKAEELRAEMSKGDIDLFGKAYEYDPDIDMLKLDRSVYTDSSYRELIDAVFERAGFTSKFFTNSQSTFQYYNMNNLWDDISKVVVNNLTALHVCSAPLSAGDIHLRLTGRSFSSLSPHEHHEDMRSIHSEIWGENDHYLYPADKIMADLEAYYNSIKSAHS